MNNNEVQNEPKFDLDYAKRKINSILDDISRVEYLRGWNECLEEQDKIYKEEEE